MAAVFVFEGRDRDADSWTSELAVLAESPQEAFKRLREAGLHKKQLDSPTPSYVEDPGTFEGTFAASTSILRRRDQDSGWTAWEAVPEGEPLLRT